MSRPKGLPKTGGRKKGSGLADKLATIQRWEKAGLYKLADKIIKISLLSPKTGGNMAQWLYDHKIGKAPQSHDVQGDLNVNWSALAGKICQK
jgi:hypothetical protein